jgi:GxxExxY protein
LELEQLSDRVIGCAIDVHRGLGPGLLESVYAQCLAFELARAGISFEAEKPIPVAYKDVRLDCGFRVDLMVENSLIVEAKAVEKLLPIHRAQLLYLHENGADASGFVDQLQLPHSQGRLGPARSVNLLSPCSPCSPWFNLDLADGRTV